MATEVVFRRRRAWATNGIARWLFTTNHKDIGVLYLVTTMGFFVLGEILALLMRLALTTPVGTVVSPDTYTELFSIHGSTMVFLVAIPPKAGSGETKTDAGLDRHVLIRHVSSFGSWSREGGTLSLPSYRDASLDLNRPLGRFPYRGYRPGPRRDSDDRQFLYASILFRRTREVGEPKHSE